MSNNGTLVRNLIRGGSGGGGSPTEIALLSVTTAPSGSFAVGSKYYNSSTKKIVTAVTADTWTGATSADPVFNVIYTYDSGVYVWDGNSLEPMDLNLYATKVELATGLAGKIDKYSVLPTPTIDFVGIIAQYVGTTGDGGTNGYFYKGTSTPIDSSITAGIGTSTGITEASVVKATFEGLITASGTYDFVFSASTASADIGASTGITASSVVVATFETLLTATGDYVFTFDGTDWKYDGSAVTLSDYGISVTGTPNENDTVTVSYVKADWKYDGDIVTLSDYGITAVGTPDDQDTISVVYAVAYVAYSWLNINVQTGSAEVITVSSATPSFTSSDKLKVNANYQCGTITSLTFDTSSVDDSQLETTIRFTAGVSFAFSYTNALVKINGELPTFEEDGEYIILIVNKTIFVSDKIVAGV